MQDVLNGSIEIGATNLADQILVLDIIRARSNQIYKQDNSYDLDVLNGTIFNLNVLDDEF